MKRIPIITAVLCLVLSAGLPQFTKADDHYLTYAELEQYHQEQLVKQEQLEEMELLRQQEEKEKALSTYWKQKAYPLRGKWGGQCVTFIRSFTGIDRSNFNGYAGNIQPNYNKPEVGVIVRTREGRSQHVQFILEVNREQGYMEVVDSNYIPNLITIRKIALNSPNIVGYIKINLPS